jgi:hypothetical protein
MAHILIDKSNLCTCNCASKCILGKSGMAGRCTEKEIQEEGHYTVKVKKRKFGGYNLVSEKEIYNL